MILKIYHTRGGREIYQKIKIKMKKKIYSTKIFVKHFNIFLFLLLYKFKVAVNALELFKIRTIEIIFLSIKYFIVLLLR